MSRLALLVFLNTISIGLFVSTLPVPLLAEVPLDHEIPELAGRASGDCSGGSVHDDGSFEKGYGGSFFYRTHFAMRVDPPATPALLEEACICWSRANSGDEDFFFDLVVWDSDGPDGRPGTELGRLLFRDATGVPNGTPGDFFSYDLSSLQITTERPVYIGPAWDEGNAAGFFVCADENGPTSQPAYWETGMEAGSSPPTNEFGNPSFPGYRNLGIRARFDTDVEPPPTGECRPSTTEACLQDRRFRVGVTWETATRTGPGQLMQFGAERAETPESAFFTFFSETNFEVAVKVLRACGVNGHFWVFVGGLTNQGVEVLVEDLQTGRTWSTTNPLGNLAATVADTRAFPCE